MRPRIAVVASLLTLLTAVLLQGCIHQTGAAQQSGCTAIIQTINGRGRQTCVVFDRSGKKSWLSPFVHYRFRHLTVSWRYHCPKRASTSSLTIVLAEYKGDPL